MNLCRVARCRKYAKLLEVLSNWLPAVSDLVRSGWLESRGPLGVNAAEKAPKKIQNLRQSPQDIALRW